jgi:hypothetical protein
MIVVWLEQKPRVSTLGVKTLRITRAIFLKSYKGYTSGAIHFF